MKLSLYAPGSSPLHRLPTGVKLAALFITGILILATDSPLLLAVGLGMLCCGIGIAQLPLKTVFYQLRPLLFVLVLFFAAHAVFTSPMTGLVLGLRFAIMILAGILLTMTTRLSDMMAVLERALRPLSRLGINPEKASLVFAMSIRFIPALAESWSRVRDAQRARGLDRHPLALLLPMLVLTLRRADQISDAIEARGLEL